MKLQVSVLPLNAFETAAHKQPNPEQDQTNSQIQNQHNPNMSSPNLLSLLPSCTSTSFTQIQSILSTNLSALNLTNTLTNIQHIKFTIHKTFSTLSTWPLLVILPNFGGRQHWHRKDLPCPA
uniref:Uncharacterized protein n=1 Tax=Opuntia streptacantha TaxID=393608 RepID=A0A7C9A2H1_OPUST